MLPSYSNTLELSNPSTVVDPTGLPVTRTYTLYITPSAGESGTFDLQAAAYS